MSKNDLRAFQKSRDIPHIKLRPAYKNQRNQDVAFANTDYPASTSNPTFER